MSAASFTLFDTAIGRCAIAWRHHRVVGFALPASTDAETAAHIQRRHPGAQLAPLTCAIEAAIAAVRRLLEGEQTDLSFIAVDLDDLPAFERQILELLRQVPPGETVTYGELAERAGGPGAARAVGMAMGRNPVPVIIPCHRVLAGSGKSGGFSAPGGVSTKFRLLQIEQARRSSESLLFETLPLAVKN